MTSSILFNHLSPGHLTRLFPLYFNSNLHLACCLHDQPLLFILKQNLQILGSNFFSQKFAHTSSFSPLYAACSMHSPPGLLCFLY